MTERCGINLFDKTTAVDGHIDDADGQVKQSGNNNKATDFIRVEEGFSYYVKSEQTAGMWGAWYDENKNYLRGVTGYANSVITAPTNAKYVRLTVVYNMGGSVDTFAVNYPSTDHDYHAYNGTSYTTDLGRTVYGGEVEVVEGELTDKMGVVDLGTLNWQYQGQNCFFASLNGSLTNGNIISDRFVIATKSIGALREDLSIGLFGYYGNNTVSIKDTRYDDTTISAFVASLDGAQGCYELATPQTYQLTPTEVALLKGTNNVWSDGDITLEYGQDPNVIVNPTLFESKPLLELTGYGDINVNDYTINVVDDLVGDVKIAGVVQSYGKTNYYVNFPEIYINNGDDIDVGSVQDVGLSAAITDANGYNITSASIQNASGYSQLLPSIVDDGSPTAILTVPLTPTMTFHYGTPLTNKETLDLTLTNSNSDTQTYHIEFGVEYDGNKTIRFYNVGLPNDGYFKCEATDPYMNFNGIVIHSTATTFGSPTYIDCEFGEAYTVINGVYNSLNAYVALGSELPSLAPGSNSITFDNTFTNVKVKPRWWKV